MTLQSPISSLWDTEEQNTQLLEEQRAKQFEEDVHFLKALTSPHGRVVMAWLEKYTLDSPTWWPQGDYNKAIASGFFREGQNSLVRQIKAKIEFAKQYKESQK